MVDDRVEKPAGPRVSPYLRQPLRTLKKAEQDNDASRHHLIAVHCVEPEPGGDLEPGAPAARSTASLRPSPAMPEARKKQP